MTQEQLPSFLAVIIPRILMKLTEDKKIAGQEAVRILYNSEMYAILEQEETKLWHLSVDTLYTLLDEELSTGIITFPEEQ